MKTLTLVILISTSTLFNGCGVDVGGLTPQTKKDIAELLDIDVQPCECKYPKLPIYRVPPKQKVPKGMSIEEAFYRQNEINEKLRTVCSRYRRVAIVTNKEYTK